MADPNIIVNEIIEALDVNSTEVFATSRIMQALGVLGRQREYRVSCHKTDYPEAEDGEWLYDMIWWQGNQDNYVLRNVMVLESELRRSAKQRDDLDDDFPKLVQARADVRVWISTSPKNARQHIDNCKKQIGMFAGGMPGDHYVFAIYDYTARKRHIEHFMVPN
jgi:hypothetical protein